MFQPRFDHAFIPGIAKGATYQSRGAIAHIGGDHVAGQVGASEMPEHGVYRVDEVETRIDQGSVEIEDQQLYLARFELALELDHALSA